MVNILLPSWKIHYPEIDTGLGELGDVNSDIVFYILI